MFLHCTHTYICKRKFKMWRMGLINHYVSIQNILCIGFITIFFIYKLHSFQFISIHIIIIINSVIRYKNTVTYYSYYILIKNITNRYHTMCYNVKICLLFIIRSICILFANLSISPTLKFIYDKFQTFDDCYCYLKMVSSICK